MKFFADNSFWNQPLPAGAPKHPKSDHYLAVVKQAGESPGLHMNLESWTIPVYRVRESTPKVCVGRRIERDVQGAAFAAASKHNAAALERMGHSPDFAEGVPMPEEAKADAQMDAHMALVDEEAGLVWDMWGAAQDADGQWASCTGMRYGLHGAGIFDPKDFGMENGESVHPHGPGRAVGVPIVAGLIMHDELVAGRIAHKLAFASTASGLLAHYFPPAIWTDGGYPGGPPAGIVLRIREDVDIEGLPLGAEAKVVARALQEFGAALVDFCHGFTLYGEGLWNDPQKRTWAGLLGEEDLYSMGYECFEFVAPEALGQQFVEKGMVPIPNRGLMKTYLRATKLG